MLPMELIIIIVILIAIFQPALLKLLINKITLFISAAMGIIYGLLELYLWFTVSNFAGDTAIDMGLEIIQETNLVEISESFCPTNFNRTNYCLEFGLNEDKLSGDLFLTGEINEHVDITLKTKDKLFSCSLNKGNLCKFNQINSVDDFKITLEDRYGTVTLASKEITVGLKKMNKVFGIAKLLKGLNKLI